MLARRVIPVMLVKGRLLVKGQRFVNNRVVGAALQAAKVHAARGVDELMLIDVAATAEGRGPDLTLIEELTRDVFVPITVGGGVRSIDDIRALMRAGADKVLIGAAWRTRPAFLCEAVDKFGAQAIVASVDSARSTLLPGCAVGEILLNRVDRDGTMQGYDLRMIATVALQVDCPLIACGGCSGYEDMRLAIKAGASAVAAGALFQFTDATPRGATEYLKANGVEARA